MITADTRPKVLHLKPEHYRLLSTYKVPSDLGNNGFSSVECIIVHGSCNLLPIDKEKLNAIFPSLQTHTFLEGDYYEGYEPKVIKSSDNQRHVNFKRCDSKASTNSDTSKVSTKSSTSSNSSNDDFLSIDSSN